MGRLPALLIMACAAQAFCQDYPSKPVRIITLAAGGGTDFVARQVAQELTGPLAQPVVVDNRTNIPAAEAVAKSPPDGYTLLVGGDWIWILPLLQKVPHDAIRDFAPITIVTRDVNVVVVHPSLPVHSIKDLIAFAKARPGELNYAAVSSGGAAHLGAELFKSMAGVNIVHVGYKSTTQAVAALIGGEVQLTFLFNAASAAPHVKSGKLRALAVTSAEPSALSPGLPTVASTLPGYELVGVTVMLAPSKTPIAVVNRLNQETVRGINRPEVKERFLNSGLEVVGNTPDQFAATIKSDTAKWAKVIKDAGIRME